MMVAFSKKIDILNMKLQETGLGDLCEDMDWSEEIAS